jgi:hypothetical protein
LNEAAVRLGASYADFAEKEAAGRSPLYAEICRGIAGDAVLLQRLAALPLEKQQPNLLLAAVKYLFGVARDYQAFQAHVTGQWEQVIAVVMNHRTQTNEPARCATLLPLLALLPQPLALLEVGASAGLCLLPDHYAYDYGDRSVPPTADIAPAPLFRCRANAETPVPSRTSRSRGGQAWTCRRLMPKTRKMLRGCAPWSGPGRASANAFSMRRWR